MSAVALTRGATEALQELIGGDNRLGPGDAVLYCDLDYGAMQAAMRWLQHRDIGAPFIGFNLHKWIGASLGAGCMYIRADRLDAIDRDYADDYFPPDDIQSRVHTGTVSFATWNTIPKALEVHRSIGPAAKAARLAYLRTRWVRAAVKLPGVQILTPVDGSMSAAITSFRIRGRQAEEIVRTLRDEHRILTVLLRGTAAGNAVRVTPALHNSEEDVDRLVEALRALA